LVILLPSVGHSIAICRVILLASVASFLVLMTMLASVGHDPAVILSSTKAFPMPPLSRVAKAPSSLVLWLDFLAP
jgi:hypothetical protein